MTRQQAQDVVLNPGVWHETTVLHARGILNGTFVPEAETVTWGTLTATVGGTMTFRTDCVGYTPQERFARGESPL